MYETVARLRKSVPELEATYIAVFFNYKDRGFRLDWDLPDSAALTDDQIIAEMDKRIRGGLQSDPQTEDGPVDRSVINDWKAEGWQEW